MPLESMIRKNLTYAALSTSIEQVAKMMKEDNVGAVLIVEEGMPRGIITDRDIILRCVADGLDPAGTPAKDLMSTGVETVSLDQGLYDVAQTMKRAQVRRVAVVDAAGNAAGLLSFDDMFDLLMEEMQGLREAITPYRKKIVSEAA